MSLNNIPLDFPLIQELYGQQLVDVTAPPIPIKRPEKKSLLGNYGKRVLILVKEPSHAYLSDEDLQLLTGIIAACKLSMDDIGVLNLNSFPSIPIATLRDIFNPTAWWLFGVEPEDHTEKPMQIEQSPVFTAPSLLALSKQPDAKRRLWEQLRKIYT
jgi:DNA polymerase III psi subunit